jgi:hypothetical protein
MVRTRCGSSSVEVSRLSRSSEDWRRLLGLCGVAGVAVVDEQAIYNPSDPDDKLLLGLKGTMSEAELHWLGLRLMGARRQKARRGELEIHPPTGYVWRDGGLALDPDQAVVPAIRTLFEHDELTCPASPRRIARETKAQRLGDGKDPLSVRCARQDARDPVRGGVRHAPRRAARARQKPWARMPHLRQAASSRST